jgi:hypothetical protein
MVLFVSKSAANKGNDVPERKNSPCLYHAWTISIYLLGVSVPTCSKIDSMQR